MRSQATLELTELASSTHLVLRGTILHESQVLDVVNAWAGALDVSERQLVSQEHDKENYYKILIPRRTHSLPAASTSRIGQDKPERMPMSQFELMTASKDILSALVRLEQECLQTNSVASKSTGPVHQADKPRLQAICSKRDLLLAKIQSQLLSNPHPAARTALKKLASKHDMTRVRLRAKRHGRINESEISESDIPKEILEDPFQDLDKVLKMIFEVWERLNNYLDKVSSEPGYPTILDELCCEFPQAMRHLCTTMPWTIWPALVVLWGVCWMFRPPMEGATSGQHLACTTPISSLDLFPSSPSQELYTSQDGSRDSIFDLHDPYLLDFDSNPSWIEGNFRAPDIECMKIGGSIPSRNDMRTMMLNGPGFMTASAGDLPTDSWMEHPQSLKHSESPSSENCFNGADEDDNDVSASDASETAAMYPTSNDENSSLICQQCKESFSNIFTLQRHQMEQHAGDLKKFPCPHPPCKRSQIDHAFKREAHLRRHLTSRKHQSSARKILARGPINSTLTTNLRPSIPDANRASIFRIPNVGPPKTTHQKNEVESGGIVQKLKKEYESGMKALREKELECEQIRQLLKTKELECQKERQVLQGLAKLVDSTGDGRYHSK